jgi:hypothetical protein
MTMQKYFIFGLFLLSTAAVKAEPVWVGQFAGSGGLPAGWQVQHLNPKFPPTAYRQRLWDGVPAIEATAIKSMALLGRSIAVDLDKTPVLCWRWRIDQPVASADLASKAGDDYAARVYLTFSVPPDALGFGTRTKLALARSIWGPAVPDAAINYVWDNTHPVGTLRDNAYTDRARMLVVDSGKAKAGQWVSQRRNVRDDYRRAFDGLPGTLSGLAIASDTDNTGETAHAGFADFHFVGENEACASR